MSRIGRQTIEIPQGVTAEVTDGNFSVKGPKGELSRKFKKEVEVVIEDNAITFKPKSETLFAKAMWGTTASHVANMVKGVTEGYEKKLVVEGVGYKVELQGKDLVLSVGFSHQVKMPVPEGLEVKVEKNTISIAGPDKEQVGLFASKVRLVKKPEPYKGKGIRYENEVVRRKQGKKAVA